jgi:hypothetical protein
MNIVKTDLQLDMHKLLEWYTALKDIEEPVSKNDTIDYAKNYFEPGSSGYGWALHVFSAPSDVETVWWRNPDRKDDPMIRSKGRLTFKDGKTAVIGNEHLTKRRPICDGYMSEVLDMFPEAYRGVVWVMNPGFKFVEHIDYPQGETYRFHVVLQTNQKSMFKIQDDVVHMPADGYVWMVKTGTEMHTAWNHGDSDRVHIHWQMPIATWESYSQNLIS